MTKVCSPLSILNGILGLGLTSSPTARYIWQKGSIAGPSLKMPFMGPFLESVNPKFSQYLAKWDSGPLSCVSVFHKYGRNQS